MTATQTEVQLCTRCGQNPRDTDSYPKWCKQCRQAYKKEAAELKAAVSETRGFAAGISAMRECLALEFERLGSGMFAAYEVARLIRQAPGPERA